MIKVLFYIKVIIAGDALEKSQIKKRKTNLADELTAIEKIGK